MTEPNDQQQDENEIIALRKARLAELRAQGNAFPNDFRRQHEAKELHNTYGDRTKEELLEDSVATAVAGRIVLRRMMGKASFMTIQDVSGRIQLYVRQSDIGDEAYSNFKRLDIGDIVGAQGTLMVTNTGELTVNVSNISLLTKSLRPLPEKHKGLTDTEIRYRQRYLDLIVNDESREIFIRRAKIIEGIRR